MAIYPPDFHFNRFQDETNRIERINKDIAREHSSQQVLAMENRSKFNYLAFAVVGVALTFNPEALTNMWTVIGGAILLGNSLLFGYVADTVQLNLNMQKQIEEDIFYRNAYKPYAIAYDKYTRNILSEDLEKDLIIAFADYLEVNNTHEVTRPKKTKLSIGYWYFALFTLGFVLFSIGVTISSIPSEITTSTTADNFVKFDYRNGNLHFRLEPSRENPR